MDAEYDAIVLGTGLKECIISGLLSVHGYKAGARGSRELLGDAGSPALAPAEAVGAHARPPASAGAPHRPQQLLRRGVGVAEPHAGAASEHGALWWHDARVGVDSELTRSWVRAALRALQARPAASAVAGPQPRVQCRHGAQGGGPRGLQIAQIAQIGVDPWGGR
jgi:hypothetical protein